MGHDVEVVTAPSEADSCRILVLSKRYDDEALTHARRLRQQGGVVVLDLCDNHLDAAHEDVTSVDRRRRLTRMLLEVDHLVVSTPALAEIVTSRTAYSGPITVIGDPVEDICLGRVRPGWRAVAGAVRLEPLRARLLSRRRAGTGSRVLWFGAHGVSYADGGMLDIGPLLRRCAGDHRLSLTVVSNNWWKFVRFVRGIGVPTTYFEWNPRSFEALVRAHDLCVIPIKVNPFTMCKSNNRPATALWHGVPVVADAIPSYEELRSFTMLNRWEEGIRTYLEHPEVAAEHVRAGRDYLKARYGIDAITRQWLHVFAAVSRES
jgi:hypothetical protein